MPITPNSTGMFKAGMQKMPAIACGDGLREVMSFIKYSKDKENLDRILKADEKRFQELERRAADVIEAVTNSGIKYDEGEVAVDVCTAIQEMRMESEEKRLRRLQKIFMKWG